MRHSRSKASQWFRLNLHSCGAGTRGAAGEIPTTPTGPITPDTGAGAGEGLRRNLTPILLIGGAAAALYFITKKK